MKYVNWVAILLFTALRKVLGLFIYPIVVHFRGKARSVVYNYILANNLWLKRLYENTIEEFDTYYKIGEEGVLYKKSVSRLEYNLWYWLVWGWVDDDSNYDIVDKGYIETILSGERYSWFSDSVISKINTEYEYISECKYSDTFCLGDIRRELYPVSFTKSWVSTLLWTKRNTAYNFKYKQWETCNKNDVFLFEILGYSFGWTEEGIVDGKQNYTLMFFEKLN